MANNQSRPPRRGPMGPGMGPGVGEKAKDFKSAVKRLVKELGKFKILIIIALILAIAGAVLSISAPDRLSKLTDEIQAGIIPKMENGQIIMPEINMDAIKSIAISLVILYLFSAICT
ncbi:MAG: ABC transporter ATP-binding protein, partial [Clostridia bacterium]